MPEGSREAGVAIVDDDVELVRTYELIFRKRQVPVAFVAYDGKSALEKFRDAKVKPAVVIIDYRMPLMSGLELAGEIKKNGARHEYHFH
jgi:two-component system, cell cycle response regulator